MTKQELWAVRTLNERIHELEVHIATLRRCADVDTSHLDGLPHATPIESKIERLVLEIAEQTAELNEMKAQLKLLAANLTLKINRIPHIKTRTVMLLRYVLCLSFRQIAVELDISIRTVFNFHSKGILQLLGTTPTC